MNSENLKKFLFYYYFVFVCISFHNCKGWFMIEKKNSFKYVIICDIH